MPRGDESVRTGTRADFLIVGLGNPGAEYDGTRHNVGADAVRLVAARFGQTLRVESSLRASHATALIGDARCLLAVPTTYMNESGAAVKPLLRRAGIETMANLIIVHDELDLDPGVVRVKVGGGLAGHNGLRSITGVLATQDYLRVRLGIGKPPSKDHGAKHVLTKVSKAARVDLDLATALAADAVEAVVTAGVEAAMGTFNAR